ncbi:type-F conjugative transfer system mating-pair stabilization protein TraN [Serratia plymuthica]|uniref:Type-F conjugative transfer system mating-pair stabilization protein TraN n=1 Tax=Serratia plymuthica TaxID=82996 RepID=A0A318NS73_SERPL|nr:type-F conjugative transfer system mating-pair stabilization protein TraN [Serratia plymuthica]PYD36594.1 type-F conjugative transfer system mating-pair stabilization protein TraN [Serratia plymuthica]
MRKLALVAMLALSLNVIAAGTNDTYREGVNFAKDNKGQGTDSLNKTKPGDVIPGYTNSPKESEYYQGVTQPSSDLTNRGQNALATDNAAKTMTDSFTKNPKTAISPDATFIQTGRNAELQAAGITNGTYEQCTSKVISKTDFVNQTCSKDIAVTKTCNRAVTIDGDYVTVQTDKSGHAGHSAFTWSREGNRIKGQFTATFTGELNAASVQFSLGGSYGYSWPITIEFMGTVIEFERNFSGTKTLPVRSFHITEGQPVVMYMTLHTGGHDDDFIDGTLKNLQGEQGLKADFSVDMAGTSTIQEWRPKTNVAAACPEEQAGKFLGTECTVAGGDRTTIVNGQVYTIHSDCWQYTDRYLVNEETEGTCGALMANHECTVVQTQCSESTDGYCSHQNVTYQCQRHYSSQGVLCGGDYFCQSGDCAEMNTAGDSQFEKAISSLAGVASAGDSIKNDQVNVRAFTGRDMSCRKAMAGFSNCCKDSGWGNSVGIAHCSSDEKALGKAKEKQLTVSLGETCARKVLGVCIQKKQVYCTFDSKLARIIQEQGRSGQLGLGFGGADSPDCRGITVDELSRINFDRINFQDFYQDLENNTAVPDSNDLINRVKQQINSQVQQNGGSK